MASRGRHISKSHVTAIIVLSVGHEWDTSCVSLLHWLRMILILVHVRHLMG